MTQPQWHAHQYNNWLYGKTKQAKQKPKAHILNICPFLWCNYSHCGWFQVTSGLTTGLQKSWKFTNWLLWAVVSWVKHTATTGSHFCPGHLWSKPSLCKSCQELQQHGWYQLCRDHRKAVADPRPSAKGTRTSQQPCTDPCQPWAQGKVEDESWEDGCYWPAKPTATGRPHQAKRLCLLFWAYPWSWHSPMFSVLISTPWWRCPSRTLHELDLSLEITHSLFIHHFLRKPS